MGGGGPSAPLGVMETAGCPPRGTVSDGTVGFMGSAVSFVSMAGLTEPWSSGLHAKRLSPKAMHMGSARVFQNAAVFTIAPSALKAGEYRVFQPFVSWAFCHKPKIPLASADGKKR